MTDLVRVLDPEVDALIAASRSMTGQAYRLTQSIGRVMDDLTDHVQARETGRIERRQEVTAPPIGLERRRA